MHVGATLTKVLTGPGDDRGAGAGGVDDREPEGARRGEEPADFPAFADRVLAELSRLAYLLTGDHTVADDLTADTLLAAWRQWDRIQGLDHPMAYVRRIMINIAASRIRAATRERRRLRLFHSDASDTRHDPDGAAVVDVRTALLRLPSRRRACVVLRHAFDLSEAEVADVLGISVGTVKSQTSRGLAQLQQFFAGGPEESGGERTIGRRPDVEPWRAR